MNKLKWPILCLIFGVLGVGFLFKFTPKEQAPEPEITKFDKHISSISGPSDELKLLRHFPLALYKTYEVEDVGTFYVDNRDDMIKNGLRSGKAWEGRFLELMEKHVKPGTTVLDIGAHVGTYTVPLSKFVGNEGQVIAFEPQMKLFMELIMNVGLNDHHNVIAYRCAVGDKFASVEMNPSFPGNEGATMIGKGGDPVKMIPLDSLKLTNVSFMKIDVENVEYDVLVGAKETIRNNRPHILIEILGNTYSPIANREARVQQTLKFLQDLGYQLTYVEGSWSDWFASPIETSTIEKHEV